MGAALLRYRVLAWTTGVFLLLLTLHVILKYGFDSPGLGAWVPIAHGWLYLLYVVITVDLWLRTRLDVRKTVLVVLAGTVPLCSFFAERWVTHQVEPLLHRTAPAAGTERTAATEPAPATEPAAATERAAATEPAAVTEPPAARQ